jgi:hypothetical protein
MAASPDEASGRRGGVGAFIAGIGVGTLGGLIGWMVRSSDCRC